MNRNTSSYLHKQDIGRVHVRNFDFCFHYYKYVNMTTKRHFGLYGINVTEPKRLFYKMNIFFG